MRRSWQLDGWKYKLEGTYEQFFQVIIIMLIYVGLGSTIVLQNKI